MPRLRYALLLLVPLALAAGAFLFWRGQPRQVEIGRTHVGEATELVYATGFVEAEQPVSVASRLTAPVAEVLVAEGDRVRRGQPLLRLENSEQRGLLAQADAEALRTELSERRILTLYGQGWVARAARDEAVAAADGARAVRRSVTARLQQLVVRAGIDGVVLKRDVEPGDLAVPTRVLMTLGDPRRIRVTATVDERDVPRLQVGQMALMRSDAWPGRVIRGHVREITPGGNPDERAFRVRLAVDEAAALPLGLTLEVNVATRRDPRALLAPASALSGGALWTIDAGKAHRLPVATGIAGADQVQILSGARPGQVVILDPPAGLAEGERVAPARRK